MNLRPACWNCGAPARCARCGSSELRNGRGDCAECHRRRNRKGGPRQPAKPKPKKQQKQPVNFEVTPAMRAYLAAFDAWLLARDRPTRRARAAALERLENDRG